MKLVLPALFLTFLMSNCTAPKSGTSQASTVAAQTPASLLDGEWVLKNVFLGDVLDRPCGAEEVDSKDQTLTFEPQSAIDGKVFGQSAINSIHSTYQVAYAKSGSSGTIKFASFGMTRMGGPQNLMQCESRLMGMLQEAVNFQVVGSGKTAELHIGRLRTDDTPSRDGGSYLIYVRK